MIINQIRLHLSAEQKQAKYVGECHSKDHEIGEIEDIRSSDDGSQKGEKEEETLV